MASTKLRLTLMLISALLGLSVIAFAFWIYTLDKQISDRIGDQWFLPPVEFYTGVKLIVSGQKIKPEQLRSRLSLTGYRQRLAGKILRPGDFSFWPLEDCQNSVGNKLSEESKHCFIRVSKDKQEHQMLVLSGQNIVTQVYSGQPLLPTENIKLEPKLFAQYYGGLPILKKLVSLGDVPLDCLQAVTAVEDSDFLDHPGISVTGILRVIVQSLTSGRVVGGASTITQQLVKNYFLTSERTLSRKVNEMFMAMILESRYEKELIFENYLNVIYMGQNGAFQVHGFGAAAEHYFSKPLQELELRECTLLAAILNNPGRFNPFRHPENAIKRRTKVLRRMLEVNHIDQRRYDATVESALPKRPPRLLSEPAPYFVSAVRKQVKSMDYDLAKGLKIFTTLDIEAQEAAQSTVRVQLENLTKNVARLKEQKENGQNLEALLISMDLESGGILALVGGSSFRKTQYNRATEAHRQVGSIMKPFVYLSALETIDSNGNPYTPLTSISDDAFEHKYDGQTWSPVNYDGVYHGQVPMFYALKNSFNVATAKLGLDVGLSNVIDTARRAGITSEMKEFPSLSLGAFELYPMEVIRAYATLARMGKTTKEHLIERIESYSGEELYHFSYEPELAFNPATTAILVGMMKQTLLTGTGRSIPSWRGFTHPAAGKTGTTSDTKDAWFVGFTPHVLTVVWVGYDNNRPHGLTGSSGAIPFWASYMKKYATQFPADDFAWPDEVSEKSVSATDLETLVFGIKDHERIETKLIMKGH